MCRRIECSRCGKPTFAGCGRHVEQVLGDVPPDGRCRCAERKGEDEGPRAPSFIRRLFGGGDR